MNNENSVWKLIDDLNKKQGITEIIVNDTDNVYIERDGELIRLNVDLIPKDIMDFCVQVAKLNKVKFGSDYPIIDGILPDGSRINIISPDYTDRAPAITIRKYLNKFKTFDELDGEFYLNEKLIKLFKTLVQSKKNVIISGGTGVGKTTFMNLMLQEIGINERVITIEDTKELKFNLPNTVRLLTANRGAHLENPLRARDLLKNSLRMRPDRIIIGEVRDAEVFDLLQAMNTGHEGSMCTIHANSPSEAISRMENLFYFTGIDLPLRVVRSQIETAVNFIIQLSRSKEGHRVISKVTELTKMEGEIILLQDIFKYNEEEGAHFTGLVPNCMRSLMEYGIDPEFFNK